MSNSEQQQDQSKAPVSSIVRLFIERFTALRDIDSQMIQVHGREACTKFYRTHEPFHPNEDAHEVYVRAKRRAQHEAFAEVEQAVVAAGLMPAQPPYKILNVTDTIKTLSSEKENEEKDVKHRAVMEKRREWISRLAYHFYDRGWDPEYERIEAERVPKKLAKPGQLELPAKRDTGRDLLQGATPDAKWIVEGLLPMSGLLLLAARPKGGKSTLAYQLIYSALTGLDFLNGAVKEPIKAVLISTDDPSEARVRRRFQTLRDIMPGAAEPEVQEAFEKNLLGAWYEWPAGDPFLPMLHKLIREHADLQMLVIDAYASIKGKREPGKALFDGDYEELGALRKFAHAHGILIVLLIHTRKAQAGLDNDPIDEVQSTSGITAATDDFIGLRYNRKEQVTVLSMKGRNLDMNDFELGFIPAPKNSGGGGYFILQGPAGNHASKSEQRVLEALSASAQPMTNRNIAAALGVIDANVQHPIKRLLDRGHIERLPKDKGAGHLYQLSASGRMELERMRINEALSPF